MPLSLVLFDCDGVLVDSEIISAKVDSKMLKEVGYEISPSEIAERFAGLTQDRIAELLQEEAGIRLPEDYNDRQRQALDERLAAEVEAIAGVHEMLDRIDLPRAICSNSSGERLKMMLERVKLWDRFRPYVFPAREVGTKKTKPAPDVYLYGCREFDAKPAETIVLEDSVHGVAAAAAAGCRVVGFVGASHTYPGHADSLTDAGAETVIRRLSEFPAVVEAFADWEQV
ncbi:HAD family hydrolase [Aureimonas phyllosphaerae]|uniref:HAD superfamily hydrolase (TIGR01509 family) n=1 Tax=Aureimonas phyllosphaerae TaxID=1166078 RepID=A0A7W6FTC7_9HYPH|nr:HAD family phosphatase [Aureimonas phyllosphaerae]MBB3935039.1 HAD superfamily hydrolase (TIGR01509 family) [Aureimonas phyllosphaerae]MBB3959047.1 HAD superfamily hydrolase (TIGR01509 family) [Aureimonas phyllosphaerae]SFF08628.1 haloacid dehalogenase superfamily, subfamily IA, variant 3 with third motif having DD or ED [Aureimonas phyllosphaerae]